LRSFTAISLSWRVDAVDHVGSSATHTPTGKRHRLTAKKKALDRLVQSRKGAAINKVK
jgi:hypothetical protein